jgi:hypothetical protein
MQLATDSPKPNIRRYLRLRSAAILIAGFFGTENALQKSAGR